MTRLLCALALLLLAGPLASEPPKLADLAASPEQVRAKLGEPARVSRQLYAHRMIEQWHYGAPHDVRVVFDCPRGEMPRVVRVRPNEPDGR